MHRFVRHQLLEHQRRGLPRDALQLEEPRIEPAREQAVELDFEHFERRFLRQQLEQVGAQVDQELDAVGQQIELRQEMCARRIERDPQLRLGAAQLGFAGRAPHRAERRIERVALGRECVGDEIENCCALINGGGAVNRSDALGAITRRILAAALRTVVFEQLSEL
jgi:hypothetical protein